MSALNTPKMERIASEAIYQHSCRRNNDIGCQKIEISRCFAVSTCSDVPGQPVPGPVAISHRGSPKIHQFVAIALAILSAGSGFTLIEDGADKPPETFGGLHLSPIQTNR